MKLNKKGITLIEIIISIVLISIVLIFLFTMLIAVNDMNSESEMDSTYLINKSLFVKNVEGDLKYADPTQTVTISKCEMVDEVDFFPAYKTYNTGLESAYQANECVKIGYTDINNVQKTAFIGIFYLKTGTQGDYVLSYVNGTSKSTRKLPNFEKNNVDDSGKIKYNVKKEFVNATLDPTSGFLSIKIPLIGPDGKDYTIMIPYYGTVAINQ